MEGKKYGRKADSQNIRDRQSEEHALYILGWLLLLFLILFIVAVKLWSDLTGKELPPCAFYELTGFYCPGCGGTRAVMALARGQALTSLRFHPLVAYTAVVGGWFMLSHTIENISRGKYSVGMKYRDGWLWGALALVIVQFLVKNILLIMGVDLLRL